ncbi:MAG TPA: hypothetical protein VF170_15010 [Planctomycetaceae bacterium]
MRDLVSADFRADESSATASEPSPAAEIGRLVREGKFCAAARLYSEATGADLIESKLAIDRLARRHGLAPAGGCASHFVAILLLAGTGAGMIATVVAGLT